MKMLKFKQESKVHLRQILKKVSLIVLVIGVVTSCFLEDKSEKKGDPGKSSDSWKKEWSRLLGSAAEDFARGVSVDMSGNVYVTGYSDGNFDGKSNAGNKDMFLVKYNEAGQKQWSRLLGSANHDDATGVSVDASGNVYVVGYSYGNFDGKGNAGNKDMFLVKYNEAGQKQWSRLFGSANHDDATGVSVDASGNVYVVGYSKGNFDGKSNAGNWDMFLVKYNEAGQKQWSRLFGTTADDYATGVSVDANGNVYVAGHSQGNFDGKSNAGRWDIFLIKYNGVGQKQWSSLLGSAADDSAKGVSVDASGNVYVAGDSRGNFDGKSNAGDRDMLLVKYNEAGEKQWSRLLGSANHDDVTGVSIDTSGNVYVAGYSIDNFDGKSNTGFFDIFLVKYNGVGQKQWSRLFGTTAADSARGVSVDANGNVYVAGYSGGNFDGKSNAGIRDMLLVKFSQ